MKFDTGEGVMKICQEIPCLFKIVVALLGPLHEDRSMLLATLNHHKMLSV
jgi:hypothetical protein